jgi:glucose/arabinose dehydrogenase
MRILMSAVLALAFTACNNNSEEKKAAENIPADTVNTAAQTVDLPKPYATESVKNMSEVIGWPEGKTPAAPVGFTVTKFADSLKHPRWIYQGPNGDLFVAESNSPHSIIDKVTGKNKSADQIILLRDANGDGVPELRTVFLKDLNKPFGMLVIGDRFYVANTDGIIVFPYKEGATSASGGKEIARLPGGPRHWTRNIIAGKDGSKIYVAVGSASDHSEDGIDKEERRAMILEMNADGTGERIYASGLRNPVGMAWGPGGMLWTSVNERDELGDDLVPDYLTSVKDGGFYGWPYSYWGQHPDPRIKEQKPDMVSKAIVPDVSLGSHTASLGLAFYDKSKFPVKYQGGAFIGQHGSWNRSALAGYKVVCIPFKGGKAAGAPEDFLTGFIADAANSKVYGRPVGVTVLQDGSMLVADDGGNVIWRVTFGK